MFKQSATKANKSPEPSLTAPGGPPDSEHAKEPPLPESPYRPYPETPALHAPTYMPYAEKPAPSEPAYEPYKGM